jgi:hypothetical protein
MRSISSSTPRASGRPPGTWGPAFSQHRVALLAARQAVRRSCRGRCFCEVAAHDGADAPALWCGRLGIVVRTSRLHHAGGTPAPQWCRLSARRYHRGSTLLALGASFPVCAASRKANVHPLGLRAAHTRPTDY